MSCDKNEPTQNGQDNPAPAEDVKVTNVKLDKETATMTVGETLKLTATVYPENAKNKKVSWRSENEKIGTVSSDGTVTALSPGKLYIICTTEDQEKTARCVIDVEAPVIKATGVSFDVSDITVNEGDKFTLKPVFKPADATDKRVSWKSDDTAIAKVDNEGVVTAVKVGVTTVSCTTTDGGFVAKCTVRVIQKGNYQVFFNGSEAPSSITYNLSSAEGDVIGFRMYDKGKSSFLGGKDIEVTSSDTGIAGYSGHDDESCFVKAVKEGTVTLTFSYKGSAINSVILNVLPKPDYGVYSGVVDEEHEIKEGSVFRINHYGKRNDLILYDKANGLIIQPKTGLSAKSSNEAIARAGMVSSENCTWYVESKSSGTATVTFKYGDFTISFDVVVTYYDIYFEGALYSSMPTYQMGKNKDNLVKVQMMDQATKKFVKASNLKVVPNDPTVAVVDSFTETECLVRVKKSGLLVLICYDISAGVECYINTMIIKVSA